MGMVMALKQQPQDAIAHYRTAVGGSPTMPTSGSTSRWRWPTSATLRAHSASSRRPPVFAPSTRWRMSSPVSCCSRARNRARPRKRSSWRSRSIRTTRTLGQIWSGRDRSSRTPHGDQYPAPRLKNVAILRRMWRIIIALTLITAPALWAQTPASKTDEAAVRALIDRYVNARDARDEKAIEALFTTDADQYTTAGEWRRDGRQSSPAPRSPPSKILATGALTSKPCDSFRRTWRLPMAGTTSPAARKNAGRRWSSGARRARGASPRSGI